jgi:hypothetical protein
LRAVDANAANHDAGAGSSIAKSGRVDCIRRSSLSRKVAVAVPRGTSESPARFMRDAACTTNSV